MALTTPVEPPAKLSVLDGTAFEDTQEPRVMG